MTEFEYETEPEKLTFNESVARLQEIQLGFKQVAANLHEKLELLDYEPELHSGLEKLRKEVESRATDLEAEVKRLREDLKTIKSLLGYDFENKKPVES
jgi:cell shape-determining protein MreC